MTHLNGGEDHGASRLGLPRPDHAWALAEARRLVEGTTLSQHSIAQRVKVSDSTISLWKTKHGWIRPIGAPLPPEMTALPPTEAATERRELLIGRLYAVFDRQLMDAESRAADADAMTEEKDARTLGTLARTLGTLMALEKAGEGGAEGAPADQPEPYDPDEIRARLAQRIAELNRERED